VSPAPDLLSALAEESRLRAFAAVLLGATATAEVARRATLPDRDALRALTTLQAAGLVDHAGGGWVARPERLREAVMAAAEPRTSVDHGTADDRVSSVLRTFMPHGRIETMPAVRSKRLVVLDQVARVFEPGVRYPEPDVNAMLAAFFADYAALRRYLVDEGFLARTDGSYWRTGGSVDV
jgi:hypothetical protein